jgi:lysophospholipase L1-like esterase
LSFLCLGSNDLKDRFARTPEQIAEGIETLMSIIHDSEYNYNKDPKSILLAPPIIDESIRDIQESFEGAEEKSK